MKNIIRGFAILVGTVFLTAAFSAEHDGTSTKTQTRATSDSAQNDNSCFGKLNEDEKRKIREEMSAIYSKYQKSRNQNDLQQDLARVFENHSGSENSKKRAELTALMSEMLGNFSQATNFFDALNAIEKGEKPKDSAVAKQVKEIKEDYERLKKMGLKFDSEKGQWDLSDGRLDLKSLSAEVKNAMARLISPEIAEKFFDPNRKEAFSLGDHVVRPPEEDYDGIKSSEFGIVTKQGQENDIKRHLDRLSYLKEEFLKASKEANTLSNSYTGSLLPVFGFERGYQGQTAPEIQRDSALDGMSKTVQTLQGVMGIDRGLFVELNSVISDALKTDSAGLQALDRKLTNAIYALRTAQVSLAVIGGVATAGALLPAASLPGVFAGVAGAGTTGVVSGSTGALGASMAIGLGLSAVPAAINIGTDYIAGGKKLSCAAMEELANRGPQMVSGALMAGAFSAGGAAVGAIGSKLLAGASPYVGRAGAGLIGSGAGLGTGAAFVGLGVRGAIQNGSEALGLYQKAQEAEARGDKATAKELRIAAFKKAAETGVDIAQTAYGAAKLVSSAQKAAGDYQKVRAAETVERLEYQPTSKRPERYERLTDVRATSDLDSMKPRSFARVDNDGIQVKTVTSDGVETVNTANQGDVIMSGPSGEKYVVKGPKFEKLYTPQADGSVVPEQGPRMVAQYDGPESTIKAPWGEEMKIKPGDFVVKEDDGKYYRIAQKEYEATYNKPGVVTETPTNPTEVSAAPVSPYDRGGKRGGPRLSFEEVQRGSAEEIRRLGSDPSDAAKRELAALTGRDKTIDQIQSTLTEELKPSGRIGQSTDPLPYDLSQRIRDLMSTYKSYKYIVDHPGSGGTVLDEAQRAVPIIEAQLREAYAQTQFTRWVWDPLHRHVELNDIVRAATPSSSKP